MILGTATIDVREAVRRAPLVLPGLERLTPAELAAAQEHWRVHMAAEMASARVFAGLLPQMMAAGLPFESVRDVAEMARQEVDHGLASGRVLAALGGDPVSALPPMPPVPAHPEASSPLEVVLRNVLSVSCCGETLAVAVIGAERERAGSAALREVLTTILADEVGHARFGWRLIRDVAPSLDDTMRRRLSAYLVAIFERDLRVMHATSTGASASDEALAVGASDGPLAWSTFLETLRDVTLPGLEQVGLRAAWAFEAAWRRAALPGEPALAAA